MRVELTIERLVLEGVTPREADLVRRTLETSLAQALGSLDPAALRPASLARIGTKLPPVRAGDPADLGALLGTTLVATLDGTAGQGGVR